MRGYERNMEIATDSLKWLSDEAKKDADAFERIAELAQNANTYNWDETTDKIYNIAWGRF